VVTLVLYKPALVLFFYHQGLAHPSPLIKLLAVLDKRLGKRRLPGLSEKKHHPLVSLLLEFRLVEEDFKRKE
jgi:hypothetical protein